MNIPRLNKANLTRMAAAGVCVAALQAMTAAGVSLVRITSPRNGDTVKGRIRVRAQTTVENPAYLILCVDDQRPNATNSRPYMYDLDTTKLSNGRHALAVEVYSRGGLLAQSSPVMVDVANAAEAADPAAEVEPTAPASSRTAAAREVAAVAPPAPTAAPAAVAESHPPVSAAAKPVIARPLAAVALPVATARPVRSFATVVAIMLDGRKLDLTVAPTMRDHRAFGPLRQVVEKAGGSVAWLGKERQAVARRADSELRLTIGTTSARLNGRAINLGAAPVLVNGRTVVPLRAMCQSLGLQVAWSNDSGRLYLCSTASGPLQISSLIEK